MKDFYAENYKKLIKEIEEDTNNGKASCVHRLEKFIMLKCQCYHL